MTAVVEREVVARALDLLQPARPRRVLCHGARGAGKTWWLGAAASMASEQGFTVARVAGRAADRDLPLGGLVTLLQPFADVIAGLGDDSAVLRRALAFSSEGADAVAVKVATLRALAAVADRAPLCLVLDDVHLLDSSTREVLDAALARTTADPIVVLAAGPSPSAFPSDATVRLELVEVAELTAMLVHRGVAPVAAERCAAAAAGNPGVAVAMADGLTDAQRRGAAPVPDLPRLGGELADELQSRLRALGEPCCRALVVAAAEDGGDLAAIEGALGRLGEPGLAALEPAEDTGVVELVGTRITFPDPWMRHAAYHLLAPASRRAAHRALAASLSEPHQAASRVWHLVGAASGPSDALAEALALVAADAAHRGAVATAVRTYERAVEFAASVSVRDALLSAAMGTALDGGLLGRAAALAGDPRARASTSDEVRCAVADVDEMLTGRSVAVASVSDGSNARRLAARRAAWAASVGGDHRGVIAVLGDPPATPLDQVAWAVALRHAGRTREAREALTRLDAAAVPPDSYLGRWLRVAQADLDVLAGREPEVRDTMPDGAPVALATQGAAVAARARLMTDPALALGDAPAAWADDGDGVLAEVRGAVRAGITMGDTVLLQQAIEAAERAKLPVEAGEARLWLATVQQGRGADVREAVRLAHATLQRCGVRAWDARCAALLAVASTPLSRAPDPALASLTQAELRVAEAVAEGLTNREAAAKLFLSVKTVDFHLQQIYRKLGVRSRTELAVRVAGGGPTVVSR